MSNVPPHGRWLEVRINAARGLADEEDAVREILQQRRQRLRDLRPLPRQERESTFINQPLTRAMFCASLRECIEYIKPAQVLAASSPSGG